MSRTKEIYDFYRTLYLMEKYMFRDSSVYINEDDRYYCMVDNLNTSILTYNREYPLIKIKLNYLMFNRADRFDISFSKNSYSFEGLPLMFCYLHYSNIFFIRKSKINFENKLKKEGSKWKK